MYERIDKLFHNKTIRNGGLFSIFSFFNRGISFLLLMLLAKYIGPKEYGELSMFNTYVMFLGYFVGLSTAGYLTVSFFKKTRDEFKQDFTAICIITFIVSSTFLVLFLPVSGWLSSVLKVSERLLFLGLLISFANVFTQLNLNYLRVQEKISWYGILSCGFALLNFFLTLYFVIIENKNWQGRVYAQLSCDIVFGVIGVVWFYKDKLYTFPDTWQRYKTILLWGIPLIPHLATIWMKQGLDRYIISASHTMADVGLFSFALNLASILIMIGSAFNQTNSVNLYQTLSNKNLTNIQKIDSLRKKEKWFTLLYIMVTFVILVFGILLIPLIMPNYTKSLPYFTILTFSGLAQCIYFLYCSYLFYYDKTRQLMYITFITALFHVLLSYTLTRYSLYLTCGANVVSQLIVTTLVILESKKIIKIKLKYGNHKENNHKH